jgi:hypothetical protein
VIDPAHFWMPDRRGSFGDEAADLSALAGRKLDDEQRLAVDAILSFGAGGKWTSLESVMIEARQNGKTGGVMLPVVLWDLWMLEPDRIVWTAHLFKTARDSFLDVVTCIEMAPELSRRVKKVLSAPGTESVELHSGATLEFLARSQGGGRGLGGKRVIMDEALILNASSMGALMPTLSARPNPHIDYGSSAAKASSSQLHSLVRRGRKGGDPSLVYVEYCAPGSWEDPGCEGGSKCPHVVDTPGCALDDETRWPKANHSIGNRITYDYVRAERRALPPEEFGRERLGWHDEEADLANPMTLAMWSPLADARSQAQDPVAFAVSMAKDRTWGAIAAAGKRSDGRRHWVIIDYNPGTKWIVPRMRDLIAKWRPCAFGLDPSGPEGSLVKEIEEAELTTKCACHGEQGAQLPNSREVTQACGAVFDAVVNNGARHLDQPHLNLAVAQAAVRPSGDAGAWAWSASRSPVDISPLRAMTIADYLFAEHGHEPEYDVLDSIH